MIRFLMFVVCYCGFISASQAACDINASRLMASYKVTNGLPGKQDNKPQQIKLWRQPGEVSHEYVDTGITENWQRMSNGDLRLVRFFDRHQRAIEYENNEIESAASSDAWQVKNQLISNHLIHSMKLIGVDRSNCETVEIYTLNSDTRQIHLEWLKQSKLVRKYQEISKHGLQKWNLEELSYDDQYIDAHFKTRSTFYTTDYSDVGDNESDPFLMSMINLGFIKHSSSGFYDEHGHVIQGGHQH